MAPHLQKDLQTEKQDKAHIQKELNDTLAILNKPTKEMGTQTELTTEQITQMEQEIETKRTELSNLQNQRGEQDAEYKKKSKN
jgi:hypothetical protein